jgi:hypothetical protein
MVVEIMKNGLHWLGYSRLPDAGVWDNWADADQAAVRAQWFENGKTHCDHLQHGKDKVDPQLTKHLCSTRVYTDTLALRYYYERKTMAALHL